jgi:RNA-directed DNA polymerase
MIFNDKEWKIIENICKDRKAHYNRFFIAKRAAGKKREILEPDEELKELQTKLLHEFLYQRYIPSVYATGFVVDRSIVTNAKGHVGAQILVNVDLKDFFPTITYEMLVEKVFFDKMKNVFEREKRKAIAKKQKKNEWTIEEEKWKITKNEEKRLKKEAHLLSLLVTYPYENKKGNIKNALPQGSPTSPALSNIVCFEMDNILSGVAKRNNAVFTRYADDITMSSSENKKLNKLIPVIKETVKKYGFKANEKKIHVNRRSGRMVVTGLVVNDKVSYGRGRLRILRAQLHNIKMQARDGDIPFLDIQHYRGLAAYFNSFDPSKARWLNNEVDEIFKEIGQLKNQRKKAKKK